jgi:hypothetical protein
MAAASKVVDNSSPHRAGLIRNPPIASVAIFGAAIARA